MAIAALFLAGCGSVTMTARPGFQVDRSSRIRIAAPEKDKANVKGRLEHLLLSRGFSPTSGESADLDLRIGEYVAAMAIYGDYLFRTFSATMTDVKTGDVVLSVNYSGDRSVDSVLAEFLEQLESKAKK